MRQQDSEWSTRLIALCQRQNTRQITCRRHVRKTVQIIIDATDAAATHPHTHNGGRPTELEEPGGVQSDLFLSSQEICSILPEPEAIVGILPLGLQGVLEFDYLLEKKTHTKELQIRNSVNFNTGK